MCLALVGSALRRRGPGLAVAIVTGGVSMSWWVLLMAAWQRAYGSVFTEVGALSAAFMLGMVGGAGSMRRWGGVEVRALPWLCLGGAALSGAMALGLARQWPLLTVPVLLVLAGGLTGATFPGVAELAGAGDSRRGAGHGFAAEEVGAAVAAALVGVLLLPGFGMARIASGLALLQLAAMAGLALSRLRRQP